MGPGGVQGLLGRYGYLVVFFGVLLESAGVPVPGETALLVAGALAHRGQLALPGVIAAGLVGAVVGDQIGYWVGRRGGRPFVLRWGRYVLLTPERLSTAERFYDRHGGKAVFFARFFAGLRVFGALAAGVSRMRWRTFAVYNVAGGAVWATGAATAGYLLGAGARLIGHWLGVGAIFAVAVGLVLLVSYRVYRRVRKDA